MGHIATPQFLVPRATGDGRVQWEEHNQELGRRLREGDANLGWLGDERLSLVCNVRFASEVDPDEPESGKGVPQWEVWRDHETVAPTLVCHVVTLRIGNGDSLLRMLAAHDSRTHDIADEMFARRAAREAKQRGEFLETAEDKADKLAFGLGKDLSIPAQHGRYIPLG